MEVAFPPDAVIGEGPELGPPRGPVPEPKPNLSPVKDWFFFLVKIVEDTHFSYLLSNAYGTRSKLSVHRDKNIVTIGISICSTVVVNEE